MCVFTVKGQGVMLPVFLSTVRLTNKVDIHLSLIKPIIDTTFVYSNIIYLIVNNMKCSPLYNLINAKKDIQTQLYVNFTLL